LCCFETILIQSQQKTKLHKIWYGKPGDAYWDHFCDLWWGIAEVDDVIAISPLPMAIFDEFKESNTSWKKNPLVTLHVVCLPSLHVWVTNMRRYSCLVARIGRLAREMLTWIFFSCTTPHIQVWIYL
jgi:hypothetical protein